VKTIADIRADLDALSLELCDAVDDRGLTLDESRHLLVASSQCASAAIIVGAVLERLITRDVEALSELCRCGHDKGEHLVLANTPGGACEHVAEMASDAGEELVDPCSCARFESRVRRLPTRDTIPTRDDAATLQPAAMPPHPAES
jgi:hypothetical protein